MSEHGSEHGEQVVCNSYLAVFITQNEEILSDGLRGSMKFNRSQAKSTHGDWDG